MDDYTQTNNPRSLHAAEKIHKFPAWVAEEPVDTNDLVKKASAAFADTERRLLPIHTRGATFRSAVDLFANFNSYSMGVCERVKSAAVTFDLMDDLQPYLPAEEQEKSAAFEDTKYALDYIHGDRHVQALPISTPGMTYDSSRELTKMASNGQVHFLQLRAAAQDIVKAANTFEVDIPELIGMLGTERLPDLEKAANILENRGAMVSRDPSVDKAYKDLATQARAGADPEELMVKIASVDANSGMRYRYNPRGIAVLPSSVVYSGPPISLLEKAANAYAVTGDTEIPMEAFLAIPQEDLITQLSKEAGELVIDARSGGGMKMTDCLEKIASSDRKLVIQLAVKHG